MPTFEKFMQDVDVIIMNLTSLTSQDFCDALWYDLYEDLEGEANSNKDAVIECLSDSDDMFAAMFVYGI